MLTTITKKMTQIDFSVESIKELAKVIKVKVNDDDDDEPSWGQSKQFLLQIIIRMYEIAKNHRQIVKKKY